MKNICYIEKKYKVLCLEYIHIYIHDHLKDGYDISNYHKDGYDISNIITINNTNSIIQTRSQCIDMISEYLFDFSTIY